MAGEIRARLLIVDDHAAQLKALCEILRDQGYEPAGYTSAADALGALRGGSFDILMTDLMMPGMSGIELLGAAQAIDPLLVGIIMTGEGSIETAVQAMQSGALDYILKPSKLSAILPVLTRAQTVRTLKRQNALLQAQVQTQMEELTTANRDLEAFAYSVSHDLRTPLAIIDGFQFELRSRYGAQLDERALHYLDRIGVGARNMSGLIEDLLKLSRLGRQPFKRQPVDQKELLAGVLEELRQARMLKGNGDGDGVAVAVADDLAPVSADPGLLRLVWANLLSNACKFTAHEAQPRILVGQDADRAGQPFFVRDNGVGFDMATAKDMFQPFKRMHSQEEFRGNGVGLSIVYRAVSRHGGHVWAESAIGQGACFYFTLAAPDKP